MAYDIGQKVRLPVTVKDDAGVLTNATMAIAVVRPDETVYPAPGVVNDSTGTYHADVTVDGTSWGPWYYTFTASGTVVGVYTGQFFVRSSGPQIIGLAEGKKHLNKALDVTTDDEEIRDFIHAVRWVLEQRVGAIVPTTVVETHNGGGSAISPRRGPVISVSEVRETRGPANQVLLAAEPDNGIGVSADDYLFVPDTRQVLRRSMGYTYPFWPGTANIRLTYRAGRFSTRDNFRLAALELLGHVWRASQLASGRTRPSREDTLAQVTSKGFELPARVAQLLGGRRAPRLG